MREDDVAFFPVDGALELTMTDGEFSGTPDHRDEAEHVRKLDPRKISLEYRCGFRHQDRLATVTNARVTRKRSRLIRGRVLGRAGCGQEREDIDCHRRKVRRWLVRREVGEAHTSNLQTNRQPEAAEV